MLAWDRRDSHKEERELEARRDQVERAKRKQQQPGRKMEKKMIKKDLELGQGRTLPLSFIIIQL